MDVKEIIKSESTKESEKELNKTEDLKTEFNEGKDTRFFDVHNVASMNSVTTLQEKSHSRKPFGEKLNTSTSSNEKCKETKRQVWVIKNHLSFLKPFDKAKNKQRRQRLPSAISSEAWTKYYQEKDK